MIEQDDNMEIAGPFEILDDNDNDNLRYKS